MMGMGQQVYRLPNLGIDKTDTARITRFLIDNHALNIQTGEFRIIMTGKVLKLTRREGLKLEVHVMSDLGCHSGLIY